MVTASLFDPRGKFRYLKRFINQFIVTFLISKKKPVDVTV